MCEIMRDFIKEIYRILNIKEAYELPAALLSFVINEPKEKEKLFDEILEENVDLTKDIFLEFYESQMANRKDLKQDYTPASITKLVSRIVGNTNSVNDICSGIGGLSFPIWENNKDAFFIFQELSKQAIPILLFNLSIRGINAIVFNGDVLKKEYDHVYKLTRNGRYSDIEELEGYEDEICVDCVISNPPYSLPYGDLPVFDKRFTGWALPPKSKADYLFVFDGLSKLKSNGKMVVILPTGVLFRGASELQIRQELVAENLIDSIIALPPNMFYNTSIPTILLIMEKDRKNKDILFVNAEKICRKEGKFNVFDEEHIEKIMSLYNLRENVIDYARVADLEKIKKEAYNFNIPRYIETTPPPKDYRSCAEIIDELIQCENDISKALGEIVEMTNELEATNAGELKEEFDYFKNRQKECFENSETRIKNLKDFGAFVEKEMKEIEKATRRTVKLSEVATIERSKKNKVYKRGSILVQCSATNGEVIYLNDNSEVNNKYAVIIPDPDIFSKWLYYAITQSLTENLTKIKTGLNIVASELNNLEVVIMDDKSAKRFVNLMDLIDLIQIAVVTDKELTEEEKRFYLDNMFV